MSGNLDLRGAGTSVGPSDSSVSGPGLAGSPVPARGGVPAREQQPAPAAGSSRHQRRSPRLVDIAETAGVDASTVSRVLSGDPAQSVRPATRERILSTARQQGYRPNMLARGLRQRRTRALMLVMPLQRNQAWARLQSGALHRAAERGHVIMVTEETAVPAWPGSYRHLAEGGRADGLLLAAPVRTGGRAPGALDVPHVHVNCRGRQGGNDVIMDEPRAIRLLADHVGGLGHRNVALIDGPAGEDPVHRRVTASRRIFAERGISLAVECGPSTEEGGWDAAARLLRRTPLPTACAVGCLSQLIGVLAALRGASIGVPADMSVVSLEEDGCLAFLAVPVTSVSMPLAELGSAAVDALLARIDRLPASDVLVHEPVRLLPRRSVAPPLMR
jgi:DNA-binding LacI/PurR family transcriptional regulator